ncbi:hypothetical protein ACTA71_007261 [Dictyostelium dimigraforme]
MMLLLSKNLECESTCYTLQLKFLELGYKFFSLFATFNYLNNETNPFFSEIKRIIDISGDESYCNEKANNQIKNSLILISTSISDIFSTCDLTFKLFEEFALLLKKSKSSCNDEMIQIKNKKKELEDECIKIEMEKSFFNYLCGKNNCLMEMKKTKKIEKENQIDNISNIIKNLKLVEDNNNSNIEFLKLLRGYWLELDKDFHHLLNMGGDTGETPKDLIYMETNKILSKINQLKGEFNKIYVHAKEFEDNFKTSISSREAAIVDC